MMEEVSRIVVLGAGVSGLTTALLLSKNPHHSVTVVAKHMPGDTSIEYASPWAGANILPVSTAASEAEQWDRDTWPEFARLAEHHPEAGVHFQNTRVLNRKKDAEGVTGDWFKTLMSSDPWFKDLLPDFKHADQEQLQGYDSGITFTSVCINTPIYLPYLVSQCLAAGVKFQRAVLKHISMAATMHHSGKPADLIINCSGLGARKLGGVEDHTMIPARGQTVLVRNSPGVMFSTSGTDDGDDEACYIMERAAGGGTILGGCYQKGDWNPDVDYSLAHRIMKRSVELCPALTNGKGIEGLDIVRHNVGLRPLREGGTRIESDIIDGIHVVHNYGHGGFGYQASYGCSKAVVHLVEGTLKTGS